MSQADQEVAGLPELGDANNVLYLAPSMGTAADEGCSRLLSGGSRDRSAVLCVTLTESPDERLDAWGPHMDADPAAIGFVDVGDPTRSGTLGEDRSLAIPGESVRIETVSSPADLTGIGMKLSGFLSEWAREGHDLRVCFHSLTTLLQFIDVKEAFRFLHVLTGRLKAVDAVSHFHMDPEAHDARTINTLKSVFDAVVEVDGDDGWTVSRR